MTEIRKAPNTINHPRVDPEPDAFDVLVHQRGQDVIWESSLRCPCKLDGRGNMPTCINCGGVGYLFINPVKTRMAIQSINLSTKTKEWSMEKTGTAAITTRNSELLGDMDKITLTASVSKISQVVIPVIFEKKWFAFVNYNIINIIEVFMFISDVKPLKKLDTKDYSVDGNKVILNMKLFKEDAVITVRYTHNVQYYVIDITRDVRQTMIDKGRGKEEVASLPVSGIGRRCHYVIKPDDFKSASVVDNSYK